ncbi:hypothetical protein pgond44_12572 [Psychroflexus gondwanensis ACAM 44]|jgi:hypothetical protein|uniref:Uncharacterized protein n=1 Tax=Psychroflexus gondwanensis ACAM 44 TaxID=1189619 RepID=N1WSR1_9FLAO|nr:hypothetical protein [Psychroflexus gondwanensis]EMY80262.1 hypothetical protein pgond44_12572 [Psychroflexus gondwanensis ACAM 44]
MNDLSKEEKRIFFVDFIRFINAIEFPNENDDQKRIHLLSLEEEQVKRVTYYLQDYEGEGFSLIIVEVDSDTVNLKIYEPHTDDFYEKENIVVRHNILEKYKNTNKDNTYLSVGMMEIIDNKPTVRPNAFLKIPLKSISFYEKEDTEDKE